MPKGKRTAKGRGRKPPAPVKVKLAKIEPRGLQDAWSWLSYNKIVAFQLALTWYTDNTSLMLAHGALDAAGMTTFSRAEKTRNHGYSEGIPDPEREQAFRTSIKLYEKLFADKHKLPKLDEAAPQTSKRIGALASTLDTLNSAYNTLGLKFTPTTKTEREYGNGLVQIPMQQLTEMSNSALLGSAFAEFVSVIKIASLAPFTDEQGQVSQRLDGNKLFTEAIPKALEGLLKWAESVPVKDLFKQRIVPVKGVKAAVAPNGTVRAPRGPRQPKASSTAAIKPLVSKNPCKPGTFCYAQVDAILHSKTVAEAQIKLNADPLNPKKRNLEVNWLLSKGYIKVEQPQATAAQP